MFFEFSTFLRYVFPQKKKLSRSILSLIAIFVIASIVWLVLVFLSVTAGIESKWLDKITALHAPLAVYPNEEYYDSYYYRSDSIAQNSNYRTKNLAEKLASTHADPYSQGIDHHPPTHWPKTLTPNGELLDIAKTAEDIFLSYKKQQEGFTFDDFASSGTQFFLEKPTRLSYHTNHPPPSKPLRGMALIQSFSQANNKTAETIMAPTAEEFEHLYRLTSQETGASSPQTRAIFENSNVKTAHIHYLTPSMLLSLIKVHGFLNCYISQKGSRFSFILLPDKNHSYQSSSMIKGRLEVDQERLCFISPEKNKTMLTEPIPCYTDTPITLAIDHVHLPQSHDLSNTILYEGKASFNGTTWPLTLGASECAITEVELLTSFDTEPHIAPPWTHFIDGATHFPKSCAHVAPLIAPKQWKTKGYLLGDTGHLSYFAATSSSAQEQKMPFYIAGFYDSGISAIASKSLLLPKSIVTAISGSTDDTFYSSLSTNGFNLFFPSSDRTPLIVDDLKQAFNKAGILSYFTFVPYYEYEFAKDLLEQFKSDRYLFSIVSLIILIVASTNIISMLVVMVNDRKKEIAILSSLGASRKSIALIFMLVGGCIGIISASLGILLASVTLNNLDGIIQVLSHFQGHDVFNEMFYGKSLATTISPSALKLILIATPILSLVAGIIPAMIACRVNPSAILKAETS